MKPIRIELPFRLPLWNDLLAMNHWQRKKVRDLIHGYISTLPVTESDAMIQMGSASKPASTDWFIAEYSQTIRATRSKASRSSRTSRAKRRR